MLSVFFVLVTSSVLCAFVFDGSVKVVDKQGNQDVSMGEVSELDNLVQKGPLDENKNKQIDDNDPEEFIFTINRKIVFKNSNSLGNVKIENSASNQYNFYVEIKLKNQEEVIYKSPVLEPDYHIESDYLIKKLGKGTYNSVATVFVVDPQTDEVVAEQQADIVIKING